MRAQMKTARLLLRWLEREDAIPVQAGCNNWNVARMLAVVPYPYPDGHAQEWIAGHADQRASGQGSPYAITLEGELIGVVGIDNQKSGDFELGYWIGEPYWGKGFATEAAQAAVTIGFADLGADRLTSGHYEENPASGNVLKKCGFEYSGKSKRPCLARGEDMPSIDLTMPRTRWIDGLVARKA